MLKCRLIARAIGELKDRAVDLETSTFVTDRWANFIAALTKIVEKAKELNQKTCPVGGHLSQTSHDRYYVTYR